MKSIIPAVLALFCAVSAAEADPCTLTKLASVDMTLDPSSGVATVPVTINDQPFSFLVDTGGMYSTVTESTVEKLGLPLRKQAFTEEEGFGGNMLTRYVVANHVVFGGLNAYRFNFVVMPDLNSKSIQGLLAPDVLGANDVDFDFANKKFTLFSQKHCYSGVVYWTRGYFAQIPFKFSEDHHIEITLNVDGKPVPAMLDTGSTYTLLNLDFAERELGVDPKSTDLKEVSAKDGHAHFYNYPFKTLSFGDVTVTNPHIRLISNDEARVLGGTEPRILLGMNILSKLHIYVAYGEKNLYITGADAH